MKAVLQRVSQARVEIAGEIVGQIARGILILVAVRRGDTRNDADYLVDKIVNLRMFPDSAGKMNLSAIDVSAAILVVSQFTLYGDCRKGRRPSFDTAAEPEQAKNLYEYFVSMLRNRDLTIETGIFQAEMQVHLINDGPVTFILDSSRQEP